MTCFTCTPSTGIEKQHAFRDCFTRLIFFIDLSSSSSEWISRQPFVHSKLFLWEEHTTSWCACYWKVAKDDVCDCSIIVSNSALVETLCRPMESGCLHRAVALIIRDGFRKRKNHEIGNGPLLRRLKINVKARSGNGHFAKSGC